MRNLRRLYELLAPHKKALVRHGSYLLADVVGVCRERPLPPAAQRELLPGIHALLGMCTEVEVQAVHAASDPGRQRVLKDLLESYQHSFKYTKAQGQGLRPSLSDMRERERASELSESRVPFARWPLPRSRKTPGTSKQAS